MKKLLLTGASGFLGYHLLRVAQPDWEVYAVTHSKGIDFSSATAIKCDITNYIELGNYIEDIEPDAVIHTAAIADANFCQQNKELSNAVNVEATKNLAGICSDYKIPFAFTSTDLVFDGKQGMYKEEDAKNPLSIYGEQKATAEENVLEIYPVACVFRLPLLYGYPEASPINYTRKFLQEIREGKTAALFTDEYRSMGGAKSISRGILQLFTANSGVFHLAGNKRLSRYEFGMTILKAFQLPADAVKAMSQKELAMAAPRPADVSMDISKAVALGYTPMSVEEELNQIATHQYFK